MSLANPLVTVGVIDSLIVEHLTADATVAAAAAAAIDAEILDRDLIDGGSFASDLNGATVFAIVAEDGSRSWVEVDNDGGPTVYAANRIVTSTQEAMTDAVGSSLGVGDFDGDLNPDQVFAVVAEDGARTWLEVGPDGGPTDYAIDLIESSLSVTVNPGAATEYTDGTDVVHPIVPVAIAWSGDSMTAGAHGGGTTAPGVLEALSGLAVANLGVGGENSATIAGRAGGRPWLASVNGGEIPTSGGVTVTLVADDGVAVAPLLQGNAGLNPCTISGVPGVLSYATGTYTFTRSSSGDTVPAPYPSPVMSAWWNLYRDAMPILWWGQNDLGTGIGDGTTLIGRMQTTIQEVSSLANRYLVLGIPSGNDVDRADIDNAMRKAFGFRFVGVRRALSSYAALDEMGITPTSDDDTAIAAGSTPYSLLATPPSDLVHYNADGYTLVGRLVYRRMQQLGWV